MDRREAISITSFMVGAVVVGAGNFITGCKSQKRKSIFGILDDQQVTMFEELAETILPKTGKSPGAKDVGIGRFANIFVSDCYDDAEQKTFQDGLLQLDQLSSAKYNDNFVDLKKEEKIELLKRLEEEASMYNKQLQAGQPPHFYSMMKQVSILGYVTSELVGTTVFRHVPIPGRFEGCIKYEAGEKSFI